MPRAAIAAIVVWFAFAFAFALAQSASGQEAARPWIGIGIEHGSHGVLVKQVVEQTPAERAGLKVGDEIMAIDGAAVAEPSALIDRIQAKGVGEKVTLTVARDGKEQKVTLALEPRPDELKLLKDRLVGKPAPPFALGESKGAYPAKLEDLAGKVVVVEFWATWCGPCVSTMPRLSAWQEKWGPKGLRIVGISAEEWPVVSAHVAKRKVAYTVARDPDSAVHMKYNVPAIPTLVIIDRKGIVRFVEVGAGSQIDEAEKVVGQLLGS